MIDAALGRVQLDDSAGAIETLGDEEVRVSVALEVHIRYQACNDETCLLPRTEMFRFDVPLDVIDIPKSASMPVMVSAKRIPTVHRTCISSSHANSKRARSASYATPASPSS